MVNNADKDVLNYFALDSNWNILVATYTKQTDNSGTETYTYTTQSVPYQSLVSNYSMPLEFFITLLTHTNNAEYVSAVADLILKEGHIDFTIFDQVSKETTKTVTKYTKYKRWTPKLEGSAEGGTSSNSGASSGNGSSSRITIAKF